MPCAAECAPSDARSSLVQRAVGPRAAAEARAAAAARIFAAAQLQSALRRAEEEALAGQEVSPLLRGRRRLLPNVQWASGSEAANGGEDKQLPRIGSRRQAPPQHPSCQTQSQTRREREERSGSRRGGRTKQRRWLRQQLLLAAASAFRWQSSLEKEGEAECWVEGEGRSTSSYWTRLSEDCASRRLFLKRLEPPLPSELFEDLAALTPEALLARQSFDKQQTRRRYVRLLSRFRRLLLLSLQQRPPCLAQKKQTHLLADEKERQASPQDGILAAAAAASVCFSDGEFLKSGAKGAALGYAAEGFLSTQEKGLLLREERLAGGSLRRRVSPLSGGEKSCLSPIHPASCASEAAVFAAEAVRLAAAVARSRDLLGSLPDEQLLTLPSVERLQSVRSALRSLRLKLRETPRVFALALAFESLLRSRDAAALAEGGSFLRAAVLRRARMKNEKDKPVLPVADAVGGEFRTADQNSPSPRRPEEALLNLTLKSFALFGQETASPLCVSLERSDLTPAEQTLLESLSEEAERCRARERLSAEARGGSTWILFWRLSSFERSLLHALVALSPALRAISLSTSKQGAPQSPSGKRTKAAEAEAAAAAKLVLLCKRSGDAVSQGGSEATFEKGSPSVCLSALVAAAVAAPV